MEEAISDNHFQVREVFSKKLEKTVKIGMDTTMETTNDKKNQIFKFLNMIGFI